MRRRLLGNLSRVDWPTKVVGFDLAESGIRRGRKRIKVQGLTDKVELLVMDASNLGFPDNVFDMVIGTAVLHHVIKYPNVLEELHRIMKPGAKGYFLEGLADFFFGNIGGKLRVRSPPVMFQYSPKISGKGLTCFQT